MCSDPRPISILSSCHSNNTWACSQKAVSLFFFSKIVKGDATHLISVLHNTTLHVPHTPSGYVTSLLHKKVFLSLGWLALSKIPRYGLLIPLCKYGVHKSLWFLWATLWFMSCFWPGIRILLLVCVCRIRELQVVVFHWGISCNSASFAVYYACIAITLSVSVCGFILNWNVLFLFKLIIPICSIKY